MEFVKSLKRSDMPELTDMIKNGDTMIFKFSDMTSVTVTKTESDTDSVYAALAYAVTKRFYGNSLYHEMEKILKEKDPERISAINDYTDLMNAKTHFERVKSLRGWEKHSPSLRRSILDSIPKY